MCANDGCIVDWINNECGRNSNNVLHLKVALEIRNNLLGENIFLNLKASCIKKYQKDLGGSGNVHSCAFNQDMDIQAS